MTEYSKRDIAKIINRSHRNITYWTDFGLVVPDIQPSSGRGIARVYSERNLIEFGMLDIMVKDYGISLDSIRYILKILRDGSFEKGFDVSSGLILKMEFKTTDISDFYENGEWGSEKDLLYVEDLSLLYEDLPKEIEDQLSESLYDVMIEGRYYKYIRDFFIKDPGSSYDEIFDYMFEPYGGEWESKGRYMKIIWLGGIRNSAMIKVGVKPLPINIYED